MIVSHKYKLIFVKSGKVGGTSLEIALSKFLGADDIIPPISWVDELERFNAGYRCAQNFEERLPNVNLKRFPVWLRSSLLSFSRKGEAALRAKTRMPKRFWSHMPAEAIRSRVGQEIWNEYYKFSIERNPWDKVVSSYFWDPKGKNKGLPFRDFVLSGKGLASNFDYYSINGVLAMDKLIRYDELYNELKMLVERLGIPEELLLLLGGVSAKGQFRPDKSVKAFYDDETREVVDIYYARENRALGFQFDECP